MTRTRRTPRERFIPRASPWKQRASTPIAGKTRSKAAFSHVLWIGGATDSGKTSVARALGERHGLQVYHYDLYDRVDPPGHWARIDPERHPHMHATRVSDRDWMWVDTTPDELVERWLQTTPERFGLVLEDLRALPPEPPIVAEGYGFTPDLLRPLMATPRAAIWLVSTDEFKRATYDRRGKGKFLDTRDPVRARHNHIERDLRIAHLVQGRARELGLTVLDVDGSCSLEDIVSTVEQHFALPPLPTRRSSTDRSRR